MNQLSWLLYLGGVSGNLQGLLTGLSIVLFLVTLILFGLYIFRALNDDYEPIIKKPNVVVKSALAFFICGVLSCILPSQETMYAIAASQLGEQIIKTPLAGKAERALESWLDKQINEDKNKKEDKE